MEKQDLILVIDQYYDQILNHISNRCSNLNIDVKMEEEMPTIREKIQNDENEFIQEIFRSRNLNLEQLDSKIDQINSILKIESLETDEKMNKLKEKLFQNNFCFYVYNKYLVQNTERYLGLLISMPFYMDQRSIDNIK